VRERNSPHKPQNTLFWVDTFSSILLKDEINIDVSSILLLVMPFELLTNSKERDRSLFGTVVLGACSPCVGCRDQWAKHHSLYSKQDTNSKSSCGWICDIRCDLNPLIKLDEHLSGLKRTLARISRSIGSSSQAGPRAAFRSIHVAATNNREGKKETPVALCFQFFY
jgi:hypothetical protein